MASSEDRQMRATESIAKSSDALVKTVEKLNQTLAKMSHPAFQGKEIPGSWVVAGEISTTFVIAVPDIRGVSRIHQQDDGVLTIETTIDPENVNRFLEACRQLEPMKFVVQVEAPEE